MSIGWDLKKKTITKTSHQKITMTNSKHTSKLHCSSYRSTWSVLHWSSDPSVKKITNRAKPNLFRSKSTVYIATFNIRTLNTINQLPEFTVSAAKQNIDIICIQRHKYHHSIIMLHHQHEYTWPSLATPPYLPLLPAGLQGYSLYRYRATVCRFKLVSCLCLSMWRGPQKYIPYELIPTSPAVSRMSGSSNFDSFCDGW